MSHKDEETFEDKKEETKNVKTPGGKKTNQEEKNVMSLEMRNIYYTHKINIGCYEKGTHIKRAHET